MKKVSNQNFENSSEKKPGSNPMNRRKFIGGVTSAAVGLTVVPRHVLGGSGFIPPSDKVNIAYIGTGTQGLRELPDLLEVPEAQVVAVCDPQKYAIGYYDWSPKGLLNQLRETIGDKNWMPGGENKIPGGRDCGQQVVEGMKLYGLFLHRDLVGEAHAVGRQHAGQRVDEHALHRQRVGHQAGVLPGRAAEAAQRVARHVVAALDRDLLDRVGHVADRDLHEALGHCFGERPSAMVSVSSANS